MIFKVNENQPHSNKKRGTEQAASESRSDELNLGITTEFASTPENTSVETLEAKALRYKLENNLSKYKLQEIAQKNHLGHRICACMKTIAPTAGPVELHYSAAEEHAHYRNLMRCDNVWLCPVCSSRMTSERAEEIRQAYAYAVDVLNYRVELVTYTMSHRNFDSLQSNVDDLRNARRKMRSGRKWQTFKLNYGYVGCISSLETPYNEINGWHVHVHELMFLNPEIAEFELHPDTAKLDKWIGEELTGQWIKALNKVDRSASWLHGLDVIGAGSDISWYIQKFGKLPENSNWDVAMEMTKTMSKKRTESLHPFQILALSEGDPAYLKLWYEYANAFDGKAQIFWTSGLKELLLGEEVVDTDEQLESDTIIEIPHKVWRNIVYCKARARLLNYAILCRGDPVKIQNWIEKCNAIAIDWRNKNDVSRL